MQKAKLPLWREKLKEFLKVFALSLVGSVLVNLVLFRFGLPMQFDMYVFYNVCGIGIFIQFRLRENFFKVA